MPRGCFVIAARDVDLAEMATLRGAPPLVVWLKGGNSATAAVEAALRARHADILATEGAGAAVVEVWWRARRCRVGVWVCSAWRPEMRRRPHRNR